MRKIFINILVCLNKSTKPKTRIDLEKETGLSSSSITRQLNNLANYIKRVEVLRFREKLGRKIHVPGYLKL